MGEHETRPVHPSKELRVSKMSDDLTSMAETKLRSSHSDRDLASRRPMSEESDDDEEAGARSSPGDQGDNNSSCQTPSSQGASGQRPRTVDGKPIPFRGLSRNPRLQLALIEAVHSFKPFGYGNVKNGWKKVQEHMNAHKLMDAFEKDGVRHELSWQLCRDVFGRVLDEWKISGRYQTKMDGIDIHEVERWNELVLEIHKLRQKQEGLDDKKRRRDEDAPGTPNTPSGADLDAPRHKQLRVDAPPNNLHPSPVAGGAPPNLLPLQPTLSGVNISVFSPRISWTSGKFSSMAASEISEMGPSPGMVAGSEDIPRSMSGHSTLGAHMAQARAIEHATAELLVAQSKVNLQNSLLQSSALGRVSIGGGTGAADRRYSAQGGFGGQGVAGVSALAQAQQQAQQVQAQLQSQTRVLRESFHARAQTSPAATHTHTHTSSTNQSSGSAADVPSSPDSSHTMLERILATMERQAEEQRALREVTLRTMQSLESVVKTVASLACDVADLARDAQGPRPSLAPPPSRPLPLALASAHHGARDEVVSTEPRPGERVRAPSAGCLHK